MVFLLLFCTHLFAFQATQNTDLDRQFLKAVKLADITKIYELHKAGVNLDAQDPNSGLSPLFWAVLRGNAEITQVLLELGANINIQDNKGDSLLHLCASMRSVEISKVLINYNIDLKMINQSGDTALHRACISGSEEITSLLLAQGITVEAKGEKGRTPLIQATVYHKLGTMHLLLKNGANMNTLDLEGHSSWDYASTINEIQLLLSSGAKVDQSNSTNPPKLFSAIEENNVPLTTFLIKNGANMNIHNSFNWNPLMLCNVLGHSAIKQIIEAHAKKELDSSIPLDARLAYFSAMGDLKQVQQALQSDVLDIDSPSLGGSSPLLLASEYGHTAICELLLEKSAFIDFQNDKGWNALIYATVTANKPLLELLFQLGADPSKKTIRGETLYYLAVSKKVPIDIITMLDHWGLRAKKLPCCN